MTDVNTPPAGDPTPQADPTPQDGQPADPQDVASLPEWAQKIITDTRRQAASYRTRTETAAQQARSEAEQAVTQRLAAALGLAPDGSQAPDPEALARQVEAARAEARTTQVHLAALRAASEAGADADAMLDSVTVTKALADLDPQAGDFDDRLAEVLADAAKRYPSRVTAFTPPPPAPAGRTGVPITGSQAGTGQITAVELKGMSPEQIAAAYSEGRLKGVLAPPAT